MRTGLRYRDVVLLMYVDAPPPWRSKSRRAVLGFWHELKLKLWTAVHGGCND